ncbi:MAG: saccharopine dehydrogenase family protein [Kofleriaceae bacterium]|jgi:saccharopine dehydrogenase (NAD+, L-lysine-forming)|nr:saccharopine dehydrogenase family protein [Kofleriaceae bacterium]MBP9172306.1 saccharopine dehydrogenase family protein [Kofleriaceae bacterium]MBP9860361.1 saccharopine dehydrogenase family protein [Kofleriaceae bacterium]
MSKVLIIGAGGVGGVVAHKCAQASDVFDDILLASRTKSRCDKIAAEVAEVQGKTIRTAAIDADDVAATTALLEREKPAVVVNVALPYQDLSIMEACLATGVPYLDTANYEPPDVAKFEYKWQWAYRERFEKAGLIAVLGSGFDPGVTNMYCAHAQKHLFDSIRTIDIVDCNGGSHGKAFATNFNPEINIREITARGRYWEKGEWKETDPLSVSAMFDYPGVGERKSFLLYHEELESLAQNIRGLERIRFWMTFGESYLKHLEVLGNVGMTRIDEVDYQGTPVVPIKFLKALLPDPASLAPGYTGKTSIGCLVDGVKDGKRRKVFIYNICDHAACYREVRAQAVSYTTGVPAVSGAVMIAKGIWSQPGVWNMEQLDPDPFLADVAARGLPWQVEERAV